MTIGRDTHRRLGEPALSDTITVKRRSDEEMENLLADLRGETEIEFHEKQEPLQSLDLDSEEESEDGGISID